MRQPSLIHSKFKSLLVTAFITEAIPMLLQISDSVIAGNVIGVDGVSAVNLVTPIYGIVTFLGMMITAGSSVLYTRALGAFDKKKMSQLFSEGLLGIALLGILCFIGGLLFSGVYFDSYGISGNILSQANEYCFYYYFVFLLTPFFLYLSEMVYVEGDELICDICYAAYFLGNIAVSIVASLYWGIRGIGFGSLVGIALGIFILSLHFFRKSNQLHFSLYFKIRDIASMVKFSFLDASSYLYSSLAIAAINAIIISRFGSDYLPIFGAVLALIEIMVVLDGVGQAMLPLLNVFRGERNGIGEKDLINYSLKAATVAGLVFAAVAIIAAPYIPLALGIDIPEIYSQAVTAARLLGISAVATSIIYMLTSYYLVSEQIIWAAIVLGLNSLAFPVLLGLLLSFPFGISGLWIGYILSGFAVLAITAVYILFRYGKNRIPFIYEPEVQDAVVHNLELSIPNIMETRDKLEQEMKLRNVPEKQRMIVMLICEDMLQLIMEKNSGKKILAECTLLFGAKNNGMELIVRDSGVIFDVTDEDLQITSFRSMIVSLFLTHVHDKEYLTTTSYNRNVFRLQEKTGDNV